MSRPQTELPQPRVPADPVMIEADLERWAGERIASGGRKLALLGRVEMLRLATDGGSIEARVRGNRTLPYQVTVRIDGSDLISRCTCAGEHPLACKHAVAALEALRFPLSSPSGGRERRRRRVGSRGRGRGRVVQAAPTVPGFIVLGGGERSLTRAERVNLARSEELAQRKQQARRGKLSVRLIQVDGEPPRFEVVQRGESYFVTLRGLRAKLASCTCSDFAHNELETCRHVERVRRWYLRKKKRIPVDVVSIWCRPRVWTERIPEPLGEIRIELPLKEPPLSITRYFDAAGWLAGCPAGSGPPSRWAAEAIDAARRVASRRGWKWDLDARVEQRIHETARLEQVALRLECIDESDEVWQRIRSGLGFRLHPYQDRGVLFLARTGRAFLADDMGLGKTVQAIAAALLLRELAGAKRALIVTPASLKYQWRREIRKVCREEATVVEGRRALRLEAYRDWPGGFLILNYELVLRDLEAIRATGADLVVLDEAQRIKNWETKTARAVKQLDSPHAFVLTGTPLENRLLELHSLVEFLHPRGLGPRWRQLPYHAVTESEGRVIAYEGLDVLRRRLNPFFLRRERRAVLDQLPERTDNTFWTDLSSAQERPYRKQAARLASLVARRGSLAPQEIRQLLQALTSMRILCNAHAQYAWEVHAERLRDPAAPTPTELRAIHSPKLEEFARVLEDLLDESESKVVVFSQWERMLRLAQFFARLPLEVRDLRSEVFYGGLTSRARSEMLDDFGSDPEFRVLFSTDAGGLGLNLQEAASIVVNLEVPWNPAVLEQRIGRVHRIGQRESVQVLHFVTRGAIEERVRQVVETKRALFDGLLVDEADEVVFDEALRTSFFDRVRTLIDDW